MAKIILCILTMLSSACDEQALEINQGIPLLQAERCLADGGNIYIRCRDNREKIIKLGFGKFILIEQGKLLKAFNFCNEEPVEWSIHVKNSYVDYRKVANNGFKVEYKNPVDSVCIELQKIKKISIIQELVLELTPRHSVP